MNSVIGKCFRFFVLVLAVVVTVSLMVACSNKGNASVVYESVRPFIISDKAHNIYKGTLGEDKVIVDIYPEIEKKIANIIIVMEGHADEISMECAYTPTNIHGESGSVVVDLFQTKETELKGNFSDKSRPLPLLLNSEYISYTEGFSSRYAEGNNDEVERFAEAVRQAIIGKELEKLAEMVAYPLRINGEDPLLIESAEDFNGTDAEILLTDNFKGVLDSTFTKLMFNSSDGVMLGDGEHNLWFKKVDGQMKVTVINP